MTINDYEATPLWRVVFLQPSKFHPYLKLSNINIPHLLVHILVNLCVYVLYVMFYIQLVYIDITRAYNYIHIMYKYSHGNTDRWWISRCTSLDLSRSLSFTDLHADKWLSDNSNIELVEASKLLHLANHWKGRSCCSLERDDTSDNI